MQDWIWDGGRTSVDFLNTLRDRKLSQAGRETLETPDDLAEWLRQANLGDPTHTNEQHLETARHLRAAIDDALNDHQKTTAVALINEIATAVTLIPTLRIQDNKLAKAEPRDTKAALARLAIDAIDLLTTEDKLTTCAAHDCGVRFLDRSPAKNRQWCSMQRCGNRTKARRHYAKVTTPRPAGPSPT
jgi:predicted RNA-binding Zn ribbon-like protein